MKNQDAIALFGYAQKRMEVFFGDGRVAHEAILQHQRDAVRAGFEMDIKGHRLTVFVGLAFKAAAGQCGIDVRTQVAAGAGRIPAKGTIRKQSLGETGVAAPAVKMATLRD